MSEQQRKAYAADLIKRAMVTDDYITKINLLKLASDQYKLISEGV